MGEHKGPCLVLPRTLILTPHLQRKEATMAQSTRWCFTLNNYTDEEWAKVQGLQVAYLCVGKEVGESGTPHLQGFVIFPKRKRLNAVREVFSRAHWEVARGSSQQASEYCKKDGDYFEIGECPNSAGVAGGDAEKERWALARTSAVSGNFDAIPDDIFIRYYRGLKEIKKDYMEKASDADGVTGVWFWGEPGIGKSRRARFEYPGAYLKMQNKWWDGYQDEQFVILDDFDSKELGHLLKIWADRYAFECETKGGAIHIRPKKIVITSNYSIEELFSDAKLQMALLRRFDVVHMVDFWEPPATPATGDVGTTQAAEAADQPDAMQDVDAARAMALRFM